MTATSRRWTREALAALAVIAAIKLARHTRRGTKMFGTSYSPAGGDEVYECLQCGSTNCTKFYSLRHDGWDTHKLSDDTYVVICPECKHLFAERRRMREALAKGAEG